MVLIITACIKPQNSISNIAIRDENIRLQQYLESLEFYINSESITDIIFCDNSATSFDESLLVKLAKKKNKNLEIHRFKSNTLACATRGKSYGEYEIMKYVFEHSYLVKQHNCFVKITGRLIVKNFDKIVRKLSDKNNYFVFLGNPINRNGKKIDTRFYSMKVDDFKKIEKNLGSQINELEGFTLERSFFEVIDSTGTNFRMLPLYPQYEGISGSTGIDYSNVKLKFVKLLLKNVAMKLFDLTQRWGMQDEN